MTKTPTKTLDTPKPAAPPDPLADLETGLDKSLEEKRLQVDAEAAANRKADEDELRPVVRGVADEILAVVARYEPQRERLVRLGRKLWATDLSRFPHAVQPRAKACGRIDGVLEEMTTATNVIAAARRAFEQLTGREANRTEARHAIRQPILDLRGTRDGLPQRYQAMLDALHALRTELPFAEMIPPFPPLLPSPPPEEPTPPYAISSLTRPTPIQTEG